MKTPMEIAKTKLSVGESRILIDRIKSNMKSLRKDLYELYSRGGWKSLGYKSMEELIEAEFPDHRAAIYHQLAAARAEVVVNPDGEIGTIPEFHLRPLVPYVEDEPEKVREAYESAKDEDGNVTGRAVRDTIKKMMGGGTSLKSEPTDAYRNWEAFIADLNNQQLWIREHGGFKQYTKDWSERQLSFVRESLKRFDAIFQQWIDELEEI